MKLAPTLAAALIAAAPLCALTARAAEDGAPKGDAAHGGMLYHKIGCYQCHGVDGETGGPGGRLAPDPTNYEAVVAQMRHPRGRMPIYTPAIASDQDVADIYAYLKSQPEPRPVADIPLLQQY